MQCMGLNFTALEGIMIYIYSIRRYYDMYLSTVRPYLRRVYTEFVDRLNFMFLLMSE